MPTSAELVTPERILFSDDAEFVVMRADGGEIMFLPNHAPFIAAVDICVVRFAKPEGEEFRAAVHGGFVHVANNTVVVLASVAEPADEIDVERARRALEAAESAISSGESRESEHRPQAAGATEDGEESAEDSPVMKALLFPDDPDVALRRAQARLEAAGALEQAH